MLKLGRKILSFRKRIVAIVVGVTMVTLSLLFTNDMARRLREIQKEQDIHFTAGEGTARSGPLGTRHGARDERLE